MCCLPCTHPVFSFPDSISLGFSLYSISHPGLAVTCLPPPQHLFPVVDSSQGHLHAKTPIASAPVLLLPAKHLIKGDSCRADMHASQHCYVNEKRPEEGEKINIQHHQHQHPERYTAMPHWWTAEAVQPKPGGIIVVCFHPQQRELADHRWRCSEENRDKRTRKLNRLDTVWFPVRGSHTHDKQGPRLLFNSVQQSTDKGQGKGLIGSKVTILKNRHPGKL